MRTAFTLFELLLAIALLAAMAAIALPRLVDELDDRAFDAAAETITSHLMLARAEAQTSVRLIEVLYVPAERPHLEARRFDPSPDAVRTPREGEEEAEPDAERLLAEPWAYRPLPDGVELSRVAPSATEEDEAPFDPDEIAQDDLDEARVLRLAVFLPDGSTLLGEPVWMRGARGRIGRLTVNPWTGLATFEDGARAAGVDAAGEREDPADDDASEPSGAFESDDALRDEPEPAPRDEDERQVTSPAATEVDSGADDEEDAS